jgi:hypothetical protein
MARLTKEFIDKVTPPEKGYKVYWDDKLKGFGLRVTAAGKKVFVVMGRVQGEQVGIGFQNCGVDLFKLELLTNHVPKGVTARHYLETSRLQYLLPEVQRIGDWIEAQGKAAASVAVEEAVPA